jgi:hypothetical protein
VEAEDGRVDATGCVGLFYPKNVVSSVLGPRGIVVFILLLGPINRTLEEWSSFPLLQFISYFLD